MILTRLPTGERQIRQAGRGVPAHVHDPEPLPPRVENHRPDERDVVRELDRTTEHDAVARERDESSGRVLDGIVQLVVGRDHALSELAGKPWGRR